MLLYSLCIRKLPYIYSVEYILPHTRKRLIIVMPLKEDLISNLLKKPFFGSNRGVSEKTLITLNRHEHTLNFCFKKIIEFAKNISVNKPCQGLFYSMMAISGKGIKYSEKSITRDNNAKTEKKLPENYAFYIF